MRITIPLLIAGLLATSLASAQEPSGSVRIDQDYLFGAQVWAGGSVPITDVLSFSSNILLIENAPYLSQGQIRSFWWGELDAGPTLTLGPLSVSPAVGIAFDWASKRAVAINAPQLYLVLNTEKVYVESWFWSYFYSPSKNSEFSDFIHLRDWILYKASKTFSFGPQFELTYNLNSRGYGIRGTTAAPCGLHVDSHLGKATIGTFLGYELSSKVRQSVGGSIEGRLTFSYSF